MRKSGEIIFAFLMGCFLYSLIEISTRGYTHWSMTLTGGTCLAYIYCVTVNTDMRVFNKCLSGALFITAAEFTVGVIVNIICGWNVWDYSDMPFNVLGQICLPFSIAWFMLSFVGYKLSNVISHKFEQLQERNNFCNEITQPIFPPQES